MRQIFAVGTKGRAKGPAQWVTSYKLAFSSDGTSWSFYKLDGTEVVFTGNTDIDTEVRNALEIPVTARYVRFHPLTWNGHPTMRVEVYGVK